MTYIGLIYLEPSPLDIESISNHLGGKVEEDILFVNDFEINKNGRITVNAPDEKTATRLLDEVMGKINAFCQVRVSGIGTYDSEGNLKAFFPKTVDAANFLQEIALHILLELGLSENSAKAQAVTAANEVFCGMIRKGKVVTGDWASWIRGSYFENSGIIMIDENLRNSLLASYADMIRKKELNLDDGAAPIRQLTKTLKQKKEELVYGLAAALIIEASVRLIVWLTTSAHSEKGTCAIPISLQ